MSRFGAWGMAAALTVATATSVVADDPPNTTTDTRPWYKRMFFASKPAQAGPVVRNGAVAAPPGQAPMSRPLSPDALQSALQAEQAAYNRRLLVCVQLRQIADERNDLGLLREVDELERQAKATYERRVTALGVPRTARAPLPIGDAGFAASLDLAPEKPVDPKAAAAKLVAPAAPVPTSGTASLPASQPGQTIREVGP